MHNIINIPKFHHTNVPRHVEFIRGKIRDLTWCTYSHIIVKYITVGLYVPRKVAFSQQIFYGCWTRKNLNRLRARLTKANRSTIQFVCWDTCLSYLLYKYSPRIRTWPRFHRCCHLIREPTPSSCVILVSAKVLYHVQTCYSIYSGHLCLFTHGFAFLFTIVCHFSLMCMHLF